MKNNNAKVFFCLCMVLMIAVTCTGCKKTEKPYNHRSEKWLNPIYNAGPGSHGGIVQKRGSTLLCALCHGSQLQGSDNVPGCATCHFGPDGSRMPDAAAWQHGLSNHATMKSDEAVCNACHDLNRSYGLGPQTCHNCHEVSNAPHQTGQPWLDHKSADFHGTSTLQCSSCHDQTTKCATCHFGPTGSKVPQGSSWQHGTMPSQSLESNQAVCNQCHTLNRSYGNGPISCHNCHPGQASHPVGQPWLDRKSTDFHGKSTLQCSSCHDETTKCATCHFGPTGSKVPQGSSWQHGTTPHDSLDPYKAVCNQCHTLNRSYNNGPVSCHNCHDGGEAPHAVPFAAHGTSAKQDLTQCQQCHAQPADGGAGSNPRFNVAIGSLPQGCESAGCHAQGAAHPVPWRGVNAISHQSSLNMSTACALCHGATLGGGAGSACSSCHTAASPLTASSCTSCHGNPPASTTHPNEKGGHGILNSLPVQNRSCSTCHSGAGTQTAKHYNGVHDVIMQGFNAKTGTASFAAQSKTCANISCHGGIQTPEWYTGTINVNTQCSSCHTSSGQYNSYISGEHRKHVVEERIACTECHDTTKLANVHFNDLSTTAMPDAPLTLRNDMNYNGSSCSLTCHIGNKQHDAEETWR